MKKLGRYNKRLVIDFYESVQKLKILLLFVNNNWQRNRARSVMIN
jgi:hypothetical protein